MCSIYNLAPKEDELSTQQVFHIIDEAYNYGIEEILLTGGEPFLRDDIFDICGYIKRKGLKSIITTNGVMFNDDHFVVKALECLSGHIHFSLDGLTRTNDFFRGDGVFDKVINAIKNINSLRKKKSKFDISIGIAFTVMDRNVEELFDIVRLADSLNVDIINFQPLVSDNANFLSNNLSPFWVKNENIPILEEEIRKIREYKPRHTTIYEEPHLELLIKYYQRKLTHKDWVCFGGFKTVFICFDKNKPLVYSCHGICGNLDEISLKGAWTSKEAYRLRLHSKNCKNLCIQSCYSYESAQSLGNLIKGYFRKFRSKRE
jgi:MoaA/NifB/PqqE/SkfB family radical SAM enzyme